MLLMSWMSSRLGLRPNNPTPVKLETYECGMQAIGGRWTQYNFRYYMYAVLFVIFDVEVVFLFTWGAVSRRLGTAGYLGILVFLALLVIGLVYEWKKGALEWD